MEKEKEEYEAGSVAEFLELTPEEVKQITIMIMIEEARLRWTLDNLMED